ncbi:citryl-CoA lyase [Candidatus Uhrbacteria bacterium]|nr:citryl-CoA lyase [Candidatus Uhrbacteria bacterium]
MHEQHPPLNSRTSDGELLVRGERIPALIASASFLDAVFLLLREDRPNDRERAMLEAMLVAVCDHGEEPPSTVAARTSASTGNGLHVAIAAGLLAMGPKHGCAVAAAMELLARTESPEVIVREAIATGQRLSGFGHKVYVAQDPRTIALLARAKELGYHREYVARALVMERALIAAKGKGVPLNVDGCLAALALELRIPLAAGNALFILGRLPGLAAHAIEASASKTYTRATATTTSAYPLIREIIRESPPQAPHVGGQAVMA